MDPSHNLLFRPVRPHLELSDERAGRRAGDDDGERCRSQQPVKGPLFCPDRVRKVERRSEQRRELGASGRRGSEETERVRRQ